MGLGTRIVHSLGHWLWNYPEPEEIDSARRPYRAAIHENRNRSMISSHAAKKLKLASDNATLAINEAIYELNAVQRGQSDQQ